jgi:hypothetical protein
MRIETVEGRQQYFLRQSWLGTASMCLERGRREAFEGLTSPDSDATILGTGCHSGIEHTLSELVERGRRIKAAELIEKAMDAYRTLAADPAVRWIQGTQEDGEAFLRNMMAAWHREIYPQMSDQLLLEQHFVVPFFEAPDYDVFLEGTIDCVDLALPGLYDWKHVASPLKQWEKQRWAVQPTVYAHAAASVGILTYPILFRFVAALKRKSQQIIDVVEVQRTAHHALWLAAQADDLIALQRSGLQSWPRVDSHALCSERWCPAFNNGCKGNFLSDEQFRWRP